VKQIVNISLMFAFSLMMIGPFLGSQFVLDESAQFGNVAGLRTVTSADVQILPNLQNFDSYVSFDPQGLEKGVFDDTVSLSIFQRQKASYSGLYSIYNTSSDKSLEVNLELSDVMDIKQGSFAMVALALRTGNAVSLSADAQQGDTVITIDPVHMIVKDSDVLIGQDKVRVVAVSTEGRLVVTPLSKDYAKGTEVVYSPIMVSDTKIVIPTTSSVMIAPGESVFVDAFVWGVDSLVKQDQFVTVPLSITVKEVTP